MVLAKQHSSLEAELLELNQFGFASTVLNSTDSSGLTLLLFACFRGGDVKIVELLFNHGASIDARDGDGHSALHLVCSCQADNSSLIPYLIQKGLAVDDCSDYMETAAHRCEDAVCRLCMLRFCSFMNNWQCVDLCLLMIYRASRFGCLQCLSTLIVQGADPLCRNVSCLSVLDVAGMTGNTFTAVNAETRRCSRAVILDRFPSLRTLIAVRPCGKTVREMYCTVMRIST